MDWNIGWGEPPVVGGVFAFVLLIILINGFFGWMNYRARQATLREAIKAGRDIDPRSLDDPEDRDGGGGVTSGFILIAVAIAIVFMGRQLGAVSNDDEIGPIMLGAAAFPGLIGVVLIISGLFKRRNDDGK